MKKVESLSKRRADATWKRGWVLIRGEEYEEALKVADVLKEARYSGSYEIRAAALEGLGRVHEAVKVLEDGVAEFPPVWLLWQLLGNYRSDLGRYDEAREAYARALDCPKVDSASIRLNETVVLQREGRNEEALTHLELVPDGDHSLRRETARLSSLLSLGRYTAVVRQAEHVVGRSWSGAPDEDRSLARVHMMLGKALRAMGAGRERVERAAWEAVYHDRWNEDVLEFFRQVQGRKSDGAKRVQLLVCGRFPDHYEEAPDCRGFFVRYEIVADSIEEALTLAGELEDDEVREEIEIEEAELLEPCPDELKGVYWMSQYHLFQGEDEEPDDANP